MTHTASAAPALSLPQRRLLRKINDGGLVYSREVRTVDVLQRLGLVVHVRFAEYILTKAGRAIDGPSDVALPTASCPECGEPVEFDGGLFHCDEDGAWDRDGLVWIDASGAVVDDPSEYSRRAAAARR